MGAVWHASGECDVAWPGGTPDLARTRTPQRPGGFPGVSRGTRSGRQGTACGNTQGVLVADRGVADVALMRLGGRLGWRYRLRIKSNFLVYRRGPGSAYVQQLLPKHRGKAVFLHSVCLTGERQGPVHLALAHPYDAADPGVIVSDELTGLQTFSEYGLRFASEENFLDDKSNGFQLRTRSYVPRQRCPDAFSGLPPPRSIGSPKAATWSPKGVAAKSIRLGFGEVVT